MLKIVEVFKSNSEEERKKNVTELLIKIENNKYNSEKPVKFPVKYNKKHYTTGTG